MQLIIESSDETVLQTILEFIRPYNLTFRQVGNLNTISPAERKRRVAVLKKFKGRLKKQSKGYEPSKHEWYEQ